MADVGRTEGQAGPIAQAPPVTTSWSHVLIAIAAGYAVCFQLGKVPAALPLIGDEFGLALWQRGAIVSSMSFLTAVTGLFVGIWANRYHAERVALMALGIAIVAGLLGAAAQSFVPLLLARLLEGLGYITAMASLPAIIAKYCAPQDRPLAMAIWASTVPGGLAVLLLLSPALIEVGGLGWRGLWIVTALGIAAVASLFFLRARPIPHNDGPITAQSPWDDLKQAVNLQTLSLVGLFVCYGMQFLAVVSFLPTMLVEQSGFSLGTAALYSGVVAIGNAIGSVLAGPLIKFGFRRRNIMIAGYVIMAVAAATVLTDIAPLWLRLVAGIVFSTSGALIPGCVFTYVPELAKRPSQAPIYAGLFIQGSGTGHIVGPILLGGLVDYFGSWEYAVIMTTTASAVGVLLAIASQKGR
ncbi:MAG: MFS transporter [Pseudomonadota bacterium]